MAHKVLSKKQKTGNNTTMKAELLINCLKQVIHILEEGQDFIDLEEKIFIGLLTAIKSITLIWR